MSSLFSLEELATSHNDDLYQEEGEHNSIDINIKQVNEIQQQQMLARQKYLETVNAITSNTGGNGDGSNDGNDNSYNQWLNDVGINDKGQVQNILNARQGGSNNNNNNSDGTNNNNIQQQQDITLSQLSTELAEQQVDDLVMKLKNLEQQDLKFQEKKLKDELIKKNYKSPTRINNNNFNDNNNNDNISPKTYINMQHDKVFSSSSLRQGSSVEEQQQADEHELPPQTKTTYEYSR